jgi:hypothetical protein
VKVRLATTPKPGGPGAGEPSKVRTAAAQLEVNELQGLTEALPELVEVRAKTNVPIAFRVEVAVGDGKQVPAKEAVEAVNKVLERIKAGFRLG